MSIIAITGATGQLGQLIIASLLQKIPAANIVAAVRNPEKAQHFAAKGVQVRLADYERPETLASAFAGVDKVLLISSNSLVGRLQQHQAVIAAAKAAGVGLLAYTSILRADNTTLSLAADHILTERDIQASGLPFVILRNGIYAENYTSSAPRAVQHKAVLGSVGQGKISWADRSDYADATVAILLSEEDQSGRIYELTGDRAFTLSELAAEISRQSGEPVVYKDLPETVYKGVLIAAGLPEIIAGLLADADFSASSGALYGEGNTISALTGHPTASLEKTVAAALALKA